MSSKRDYRTMYQDGRTDGRTFARNYGAGDRTQQLQASISNAQRATYNSDAWWYWIGYTEILENWQDGVGA